MKKIFWFLVLIPALSTFAESSEEVYVSMADRAPEALTLKILQVTSMPSASGQAVVVKALVQDVLRSESGLTPGKTIVIVYTIPELAEDEAGGAVLPLLEASSVVPAFLTPSGKSFIPAAEGHSFSLWLWRALFGK